MAYDAHTLAQKGVFNDTPDGTEGGIWLSDTGPAADANDNVYVPTGNGTFDVSSGGRDYGDTLLKLGLQSSLVVSDYFTPHDQGALNNGDSDVGSVARRCCPTSRDHIVTCWCSPSKAP